MVALSYRVDPAVVHPHLPAGVEPELHDGAAAVSLVAFSFCNTSLLGVVPGVLHQRFSEVNLRVYVRRGGERGVTFVREYVPRPLVTAIARTVFNEPYRTIPAAARSRTVSADGESLRHVAHRFGPGWVNRIDVWAEDRPTRPAEDSLEYRLTHHTVGFGRRHDGATLTYRVHHPVWPLYPVVRHAAEVDVERLYGPRWTQLTEQDPFACTLAQGSPVRLSWPSGLRSFDSRRAERAAEISPDGAPGRAQLFFDSDCGVCTSVARAVRHLDKDAQIDVSPISSTTGERALGHLSPDVRARSWHLTLADGRSFREGEVLPQLMALLPGFAPFAAGARMLPTPVLNRVYRGFAAHRHRISRIIGAPTCTVSGDRWTVNR